MTSLATTVSVRLVWPMIASLPAFGVNVEALLCAVQLERSALEDGDHRIPHTTALDLWTRALALTKDEALGLHVAEALTPGAFDVLDYASRSSGSLGEAWDRVSRYHRVLHDAAVVKVSAEGELAHLSHELPAPQPPLPRAIADFVVASWVITGRQATGQDFPVHAVSFRHRAPGDVAEYERLFRGPVRFGAPLNRLTVRRELLDAPLVKADAGLSAMLERHLREAMARLPAVTTLAARVRELVAVELGGGEPTAATISRKLHMSPRTLQRRLSDEGTSYQGLVEELRRDLAVRYLSEERLGVAEVAFLLGFSEPSPFHRAFKRWTGRTPADFRRAQG